MSHFPEFSGYYLQPPAWTIAKPSLPEPELCVLDTRYGIQDMEYGRKRIADLISE